MHSEICVVPLSLSSLVFITNLSCCGLVLPDCCVGTGHFFETPRVLGNLTSSGLFFPFSNLIFIPFRKPAWKDGSTATCVLAVDNILYIANLGDSRVSRMETTDGIFNLPRALWGCLFGMS